MKTRLFLAAAALLAAGSVRAEEGTEADPGAVEMPVAKKTKFYSTLPVCSALSGEVQVFCPGASDWKEAEVGRRYALGTEFRTMPGASLTVSFGPTTSVMAEESSSFATRPQKLGEDIRSIVLKGGVVKVIAPRNLPSGAFSVATSGFTVKDVAGEASFSYKVGGDGFEANLRCLLGTFSVEGRNYSIPRMHPTHEIRIRTSHDVLSTVLYGVRGDTVAKIDRGVVTRTEIDEDGKVKNVYENSFLEWSLSPMTRVQINRIVPAIGSKLGVSVMTFDAEGLLKNNFAYTEGLAAVNSGELVPASKEESEKLAKRAAEATGEQGETEGAEGEEASSEESAGEEETNEQEEE
jgi:hypothetical protein